LCGGPSTEHDVSLSSGKVVCERFSLSGQAIRPVVVTRAGRWIAAPRDIASDSERAGIERFFARAATLSEAEHAADAESMDAGQALSLMLRERVDCVFIALHGQFGEDGGIQGFLETAGIAYTGPGILASALAFDKYLTIQTYRRVGLRTARSLRVTHENRGCLHSLTEDNIHPPLFVKPSRGGSSVGMTLVHHLSELDAAMDEALAVDTQALIEEALEGIEISCGVLDLIRDGEARATALPPTEIRPVSAEYFDYESKYVPGRSEEITPAPLPGPLIERIQHCALLAHRALGCEGMSRTDMIVPSRDANAEPFLLETNTIPGMTPTSLLPQQAAAFGLTFPQFLDALVEHALWRRARTLSRRLKEFQRSTAKD
jgi:D-alanine-D-alanine ligase